MCEYSLLSEAKDFNALEEIVLRLVQRQVARFLRAYLGHLDKRLMEEREAGLRHVGLRSRTLVTLVGDVTLTRRYYVDEKTGEYRCLVDEALKLEPRERASGGFKARALDSAAQASFRSSARAMGNRVSQASIHRWLWEFGGACRRELERRRKQVFGLGQAVVWAGQAVSALFCEADGVLLHLQRETRKLIEAKLVILHEGWERRHPSSREFFLKNKLVYAALQGPRAFWETLAVVAGRRWDLSAVMVLAGDGADWVKEGLGYVSRGVYQLCRFHLARKIRQCLRGRALERVFRARTNPAELLAETRRVVAGALDPEARARALELLGYLESNREGLEDYRRRVKVDGLELRGMGAIESNVDKLIACRMKKRGMAWSLLGAANMLAVLSFRANGWLPAASGAVWKAPPPEEPVRRSRATGPAKTETGIRSVHLPALDYGRTIGRVLRSLTKVDWPV